MSPPLILNLYTFQIPSIILLPEKQPGLFLLVDKGRILYFDEICTVYRNRLDEISGVVKAEVTAAEPLTKKQKNKIQNILSRVLNKKVVIEEKIDANIIGGIITEVEDKIYDGSIKNQIKGIKEKLIS